VSDLTELYKLLGPRGCARAAVQFHKQGNRPTSATIARLREPEAFTPAPARVRDYQPKHGPSQADIDGFPPDYIYSSRWARLRVIAARALAEFNRWVGR
jgi:hypothetical protein